MATRSPAMPFAIDTPQAATQAVPRMLVILTVLTVLAIGFGLFMGLVAAGEDIEQGNVQRIFYIHMPAFFGGFVAFGVTVVGGIQYLRTRQTRWDTVALAGVEVGMVLSLINLLTGMVWAYPIWNVWWTWDPRLTAEAIMILTYAAYLMLRAGIDNPEQRRRFASVYGIVAIVTVLITLFIIRVVPSTIHPVVIGPSVQNSAIGAFDLNATSGVGLAIAINLLIWSTVVPLVMMWWRVRLENLAEQVRVQKAALLDM
jgi:heme exporter protein C